MGLVHAEELGPFRRDFDTETVCEVFVAALRREFPPNATTALQVEIIPHSDRIMCNVTLSHDRGSGPHVGKLELAFTNQPLGVYVRVGRFEVVEFLTEQLIYVVKATANGELAPSSMTSREGDPSGQDKEDVAGCTAESLKYDLSERECEVLRLIAQGLGIAKVAKRLIISPNTAKTHFRHISVKVGLGDQTAFAPLQKMARKLGY